MMEKIKRVSLLCLVVLLAAVQFQAQDEGAFKKFAGTYYVGHGYGGSSLTLEADGRYSIVSSSDDGSVLEESGTYVLSEGVLRFTIERLVGKHRRGEEKEVNLLDTEERRKRFGDKATGKFESERKLLPVTWSERLYLIEEKELDDFANSINLGIEPRPTLVSEFYQGYLRKGDEHKKVSGHPSLPEKWLAFLLSKPLAATVISIDESRKEKFGVVNVVTINKGSADGLRVGMRLLANDEGPSTWQGGEVVSVEKKTARVRIARSDAGLKVGDTLRTGDESKVDEYSALRWDEEKIRLAKFAAHLERRPGSQGYVIAYAGRRARAGEALARANRARVYLEGELKIEEGRIVVVDGGYREKPSVELFDVPGGAHPPEPTPTVNAAEVQIKGGDVKPVKR